MIFCGVSIDLYPPYKTSCDFQWNRVRAALFTLLLAAGDPDVPTTAVDMMVTLARTECNAIRFQCNAGPTSSSNVFREDVISEETVPAGIYVRVLGELLDKSYKAGLSLDAIPNCIGILFDIRLDVLHSISSLCPNPVAKGSFSDPRPTLAEAWYFAMNKLLHLVLRTPLASPNSSSSSSHNDSTRMAHQLCVDTSVSTIGLLLFPSMGKTQERRLNDPGMSLDGPHTLAIMDFFPLCFELGGSILREMAKQLTQAIPVERKSISSSSPYDRDEESVGIAIVGASLFRAAQGGLPPWAVECIPPVYASLFRTLGANPSAFGHVFEISMSVRLKEGHVFGGVKPGGLLSGRYFETMSDKAKRAFVAQAVEFATQNTAVSWRRLKSAIKQACGGKKKDTDFNQRPALTRWDALDRV